MSTVPISKKPDVGSPESLEQRFRQLEAVWEADTMYLSDVQRIIEHPAIQEIIRLGEPVIPLMLRDLEHEPREWVWALPRITGVNPVASADAGNFCKTSEAWLRWGREQGYRW